MTIHAAPVLSIHVQCRSLPAVKPFSRAAGPRLSLAAHHTLTVSGAGLLPVLRRILFPAAEAAVRQRMSWLSGAEGVSPVPCALPAGSEVPRPVHAPFGPALLSQRHDGNSLTLRSSGPSAGSPPFGCFVMKTRPVSLSRWCLPR